MGVKNLSNEVILQDDILTRMTVPDEDTTIEGGDIGIWNLTAPTGARTVTIRNYDATRFAQYASDFPKKPHIMIRSAVDCSVNNVTVKNEAGTTLHTFDADNSADTEYAICRLTSTKLWEAA